MSSFVDKLISSLLPVLSEATTAGDSRLGPVSEMGSDKSRAARPSGTAPAAAERATAEGKAAEYDYMDEIPLGDDEDDDDDWHDIVADYYNTEDDTAIEEDVECGEWLCIGHRESSGKQTQAPTQRPSPKRAKEKPAPAPDTTKAPTSHLPNGQGRHRQDPQPSSSPLRRSRRLLELHATRETQVYPRHEGNATATSSSSGTSTGSGGGRGRDPSLTARYTSSFRSWLEMAEAQRRKAETGIVPRHPDK